MMRRVLLDTHCLLWWLRDDKKLGKRARQIISDPKNDIYVSAASTWEISIKKSTGKLHAPDDMDSAVAEEGFTKLDITLFHGQKAGELPVIHHDPFDRMLVAQAQAEGLEIMTTDKHIAQYGIKIVLP